MIGKTRVGCLAIGVVILRVRKAPLRQAKSDARRAIHPIEFSSYHGRRDSPPAAEHRAGRERVQDPMGSRPGDWGVWPPAASAIAPPEGDQRVGEEGGANQ